MEIYGRLRRAFSDDDVNGGDLLDSFHAVCRALGELVSARVIEARALQRTLLEDELASPPLDLPLLGSVAPLLDPTGAQLFRAMLEERTGQLPTATPEGEDPSGNAAIRIPDPRLRA